MTTKEQVHALVDQLDELDLAEAFVLLQTRLAAKERAGSGTRRLPASVGMGHSGMGDVAEHHDHYLTETGFGE